MTGVYPAEPPVPVAQGGAPAQKTLLFCLLFFAIVQLPYWPVSNLHDAGGQAAIAYWTQHHYQYGKEIVQNVGPLGFINYPKLYTGFLDGDKLVANLLLTALYVALILGAAKHIPDRVLRGIFLVAVALFSSTWFQDPSYQNADVKFYLLTLLIACRMLDSENPYLIAGLAGVAAFLSLAKGTLLYMAPVVIPLVMLNGLLRRRPLLAVIAPAAYLASLALFWRLCGQELANLPLFAGNTLGIRSGYAGGYNDSMFLFESWYLEGLGIGTAVFAGLMLLLKDFHYARAESRAGVVSKISLAVIELLVIFMVYKHGFVRADAHMISYFYFMIIAGSLFWFLPPPGTRFTAPLSPNPPAALFLICLGASNLTSAQKISYFPKGDACPQAVKYCPEAVRNIYAVIGARDYLARLKEKFRLSVATLQLPLTKKLVGDQTIGHFGFLPARMLYSDFNYRPMPDTISFTGWTHDSMENDAAFFRNDATAPLYLLYKQSAIDGRLSAEDDAPAQLEILKHYDLVFDGAVQAEAQDHLLLRRNAATGSITREPLGPEREIAVGEWVEVPRHGDDPVALKVRMPQGILPTLIKTIYKPSEYGMEYELSNHAREKRKFIVRMAEDGLMVAPLIDDNRQLAAALLAGDYRKYLAGSGGYLTGMTKLRLTCTEMALTCADRFYVTFEALHGLDLGRIQKVTLQ